MHGIVWLAAKILPSATYHMVRSISGLTDSSIVIGRQYLCQGHAVTHLVALGLFVAFPTAGKLTSLQVLVYFRIYH